MIDIENERVIPLREVVNYIPSRCSGKRVSPATVWRWVMKKINPLETIRIGGGRFTSVEALSRFIEGSSRGNSQAPSADASQKAKQAGQTLRSLIGGNGKAA